MFGGNPTMGRVGRLGQVEDLPIEERASYGGIAIKSIYFIMLTFVTAVASFISLAWFNILYYYPQLIIGLLVGSSIASFILAMVSIFVVSATKYTGSIYAILQGFVMGFTALMVTMAGFGGEVFAALLSTIGVFGIMMILYSTGIIRVGSGFRKFIISAVLGMIFVNLILFLVAIFTPGDAMWNLFFGNSFIAIGISVVMVILASLMILLDLRRMTQIVEAGLDKRFEWLASFGLLITLIWLYMEFLRLFLRIASRRR